MLYGSKNSLSHFFGNKPSYKSNIGSKHIKRK